MEIEVVRREFDAGKLLFIINRLGKQHGKIIFKDLKLISLTKLFSYKNSYFLIKSKDILELTIAADDVLVIKLTQ
jgi:hypothetical protein